MPGIARAIGLNAGQELHQIERRGGRCAAIISRQVQHRFWRKSRGDLPVFRVDDTSVRCVLSYCFAGAARSFNTTQPKAPHAKAQGKCKSIRQRHSDDPIAENADIHRCPCVAESSHRRSKDDKAGVAQNEQTAKIEKWNSRENNLRIIRVDGGQGMGKHEE